MNKFQRICNKYNFTDTEMVKFIEEYNCSDAVDLCDKVSRFHKVEITLGDASYLMDNC